MKKLHSIWKRIISFFIKEKLEKDVIVNRVKMAGLENLEKNLNILNEVQKQRKDLKEKRNKIAQTFSNPSEDKAKEYLNRRKKEEDDRTMYPYTPDESYYPKDTSAFDSTYESLNKEPESFNYGGGSFSGAGAGDSYESSSSHDTHSSHHNHSNDYSSSNDSSSYDSGSSDNSSYDSSSSDSASSSYDD